MKPPPQSEVIISWMINIRLRLTAGLLLTTLTIETMHRPSTVMFSVSPSTRCRRSSEETRSSLVQLWVEVVWSSAATLEGSFRGSPCCWRETDFQLPSSGRSQHLRCSGTSWLAFWISNVLTMNRTLQRLRGATEQQRRAERGFIQIRAAVFYLISGELIS